MNRRRSAEGDEHDDKSSRRFVPESKIGESQVCKPDCSVVAMEGVKDHLLGQDRLITVNEIGHPSMVASALFISLTC
jgi:hypothetical protein